MYRASDSSAKIALALPGSARATTKTRTQCERTQTVHFIQRTTTHHYQGEGDGVEALRLFIQRVKENGIPRLATQGQHTDGIGLAF